MDNIKAKHLVSEFGKIIANRPYIADIKDLPTKKDLIKEAFAIYYLDIQNELKVSSNSSKLTKELDLLSTGFLLLNEFKDIEDKDRQLVQEINKLNKLEFQKAYANREDVRLMISKYLINSSDEESLSEYAKKHIETKLVKTRINDDVKVFDKKTKKYTSLDLFYLFLCSLVYSLISNFYFNPKSDGLFEVLGGTIFLLGVSCIGIKLDSLRLGWILLILICIFTFIGKNSELSKDYGFVIGNKDRNNSITNPRTRFSNNDYKFRVIGPDGMSKITEDHQLYFVHELLFPTPEGLSRLAYYAEEGMILSFQEETFDPTYISCDLFKVDNTEDWSYATFFEYKKNHYDAYKASLHSSSKNNKVEREILDLTNDYQLKNQDRIQSMISKEFTLRGINLILLKPHSDSKNSVTSSIVMNSELTFGSNKETFIEAKSNMSIFTNFGVFLLSCRSDLNNFNRSKSLLSLWGKELLLNNS